MENAFAGIMTPRPGKVTINGSFNRRWIHHRGIQYPEPELIFSPKTAGMKQAPRDFHPMRGVSANKPYDFFYSGNVFDSGVINLGVLCPATDSPKFKNFLSRQFVKKPLLNQIYTQCE
jgi:hypothetical protein